MFQSVVEQNQQHLLEGVRLAQYGHDDMLADPEARVNEALEQPLQLGGGGASGRSSGQP